MANHLITPSPELTHLWWQATLPNHHIDVRVQLCIQAAQWGADQQLAKDAKWLDQHAFDAPHLKFTPVGESLIEAMRPKPPSLKEQALADLDSLVSDLNNLGMGFKVTNITRALEALDD